MLVDSLTKLEKIQFKTKEEQQNANYRKMIVAMAQDLRVILIKLADRLHNMRTLKYQSEDRQRKDRGGNAGNLLSFGASIGHICDQMGDGGHLPSLFETAAILSNRPI